MPSTNKTPNMNLNDWIGTDKPKKDDFNNDNRKIDGAVGGIRGDITDIRDNMIGRHGDGKHAEIFNDYDRNTAEGEYAHAEGHITEASGDYSHAENRTTTASGHGSHAEGGATVASGNFSHAQGLACVAEGNYAHAAGEGTIAAGDAQTVIGRYNEADGEGKYAFIVGGGEYDEDKEDDDPDYDGDRKTVFAVDWQGNASTGGKKLATEDYVDAAMEDIDTSELVPKTWLGVPSATGRTGVATLGTDGKVPGTQLPDLNGGGNPGNATPKMNGAATPGGSAAFSREDHVHPVDTSRAAVSHAVAMSDKSTGWGSGSAIGHVALSDAVNSTSNANGGWAATPAAVKNAYDRASSALTTASTANTNASNAIDWASSALTAAGTANTNASNAIDSINQLKEGGSIKLGWGTTVHGSGTVIGANSNASGYSAVAVGQSITATGQNCAAFGTGSVASGQYSTSIGASAYATGVNTLALGKSVIAMGNYSTALGYGANCSTADTAVMQLGGGLSTLRCGVGLSVTSDQRDKTDIISVDKSLDFIKRVNPIQYVENPRTKYLPPKEECTEEQQEMIDKYGMYRCYDEEAHKAGKKKGERKRVGVSAQQVVEALEAVYGTADYANLVNDNLHDVKEKGPLPEGVESQLTVTYSNFVPFLIQAVQELSAQVETLKEQNRQMEARLDALEK